ncbi:MAG: hypothetical protein AAGB23_05420 [Pseudomonadota bacterium]
MTNNPTPNVSDAMVEDALAARFSELPGHWSEGLTDGVARIERMKAEQMLQAALASQAQDAPANAELEGPIRRLEYALGADGNERYARLAHLTGHDLRTILTALRSTPHVEHFGAMGAEFIEPEGAGDAGLVAELIAAVKALPVEEMIHQEPDGSPTLLGYCMQAQGEWEHVKQALAKLEGEPK